jgi:hypothetical protein
VTFRHDILLMLGLSEVYVPHLVLVDFHNNCMIIKKICALCRQKMKIITNNVRTGVSDFKDQLDLHYELLRKNNPAYNIVHIVTIN